MYFKCISALFFLVVLYFPTFSQRQKPIIDIHFQHFASDEIKDLQNSRVYEGTQVAVNDFGASLELPLKIGEKTSFQVGLTGNLVSGTFNSSSLSPSLQPGALFALGIPLGLQQQLGKRNLLTIKIQPTLSSDFQEKLEAKDFYLQGDFYISRALKEDESIVLGLGVAYNRILGFNQVLPVVDFYLQSGKLRIDGLFPYRGSLFYDFTSTFAAGLEGRVQGNNFQVHNSNYDVLTGRQDDYSIEYNTTFGGLAVQWKFAEKYVFTLNGGISINRTLEVQDGDDFAFIDLDTGNTWFLGLRFSYFKPKK